MRRHAPETKAEACQMYESGTPRRQIAETMGLPLRTVFNWTTFIYSEPLSATKCVQCGKKTKMRHANKRRYCSARCKDRAKYLRIRVVSKLPRRCVACGKPFEALNNWHSYCGKRCKNVAAQQRRRK